MTREELKEHCERQIEMCEFWATGKGEEPSGKVYEEHKLILELLEQETCEDVVSRAEAFEALNSLNGTSELDMAFEVIEKLPSVTPTQEPRWIPISERLPKKYDTVIGVNRFGDIYKTELYDDCGEKKWYADGNFDVPIVAWIPFPNYMKIESEE